jgi:regulator of sigma E protease
VARPFRAQSIGAAFLILSLTIMILALQLLLSLAILVVLHEFGHFAPAKLFKTRVEKFYLFFDPWFHLFEKKIGETRYGIGWLPLGGYVKIAGMVDESMDKEQLKQPPQPWEFRSKPSWQRLIIMLGGVTVNFLLGFLLFGLIFWTYGEKYLRMSDARHGIAVTDSLGYRIGLQDGDILLALGQTPVEEFKPGDLEKSVVIHDVRTVKVLRNGQAVELQVPEDMANAIAAARKRAPVIDLRLPFVVQQTVPGKPAAEAGLMSGDSIVGVDSFSYAYYHELTRYFREHKGQEIALSVIRGADTLRLPLRVTDEGLIGVAPKNLNDYYTLQQRKYGFFAAMGHGVTSSIDLLGAYVKSFSQLFKGRVKAQDSLGGFASIAKMFPEQWHWESFWRVTATLSLILGFMNLLPIPALDGGHVVFLLYEMVSGRKPSERVLEIAQIIGLVLVLGLVVFANGLDIWRWLQNFF